MLLNDRAEGRLLNQYYKGVSGMLDNPKLNTSSSRTRQIRPWAPIIFFSQVATNRQILRPFLTSIVNKTEIYGKRKKVP